MCCKEKEMAAKVKYIKGCQILAKIAMHNTRKLRALSNSSKKGAQFLLFVYERGAIWISISILKGKV